MSTAEAERQRGSRVEQGLLISGGKGQQVIQLGQAQKNATA